MKILKIHTINDYHLHSL